MSNYTKSTDFAAKDTLPSGDSAKIVRGTEIDAEFEALETAVNSKYDSASTIAVANGGTGATTASGARTNLGLVIGTDVQAYDADLTTWSGKTAPTGNVVGTSDTQTLTNKTFTTPIISGNTDMTGGNKYRVEGVATNALAWVNFNGTGTVAIRSSYNVSSITDNGTGDYTINFTNALSDANYAALFNGSGVSAGSAWGLGNATPTTSAIRIIAFAYNGASLYDPSYCYAAIFGN